MKIIFEDNHIVVCIKPSGLLSQGDQKGSKNAVSLLSDTLKTDIYPIHRLDKGTYGLMVFAKTPKAAAALSAQIQSRSFKKYYIAYIHGVPAEPSGSLEDLLFFDQKKAKSFVVKKERNGVKKAILHYQVTETKELSGNKISKLFITLETGRTHQIRVQFASRKMPLLGDQRYGANDNIDTIALTSCRLEFIHPITKEKMIFETEPEIQY